MPPNRVESTANGVALGVLGGAPEDRARDLMETTFFPTTLVSLCHSSAVAPGPGSAKPRRPPFLCLKEARGGLYRS